jgi:hypothetical protein
MSHIPLILYSYNEDKSIIIKEDISYSKSLIEIYEEHKEIFKDEEFHSILILPTYEILIK